MPADDAGLARLSQFRDFRTRQCIPGIELGRNRADRRQKLFFAEVPAPPPRAVELDEVRTPPLDELAPLPGNSARIPNVDFAGHDRRNEYARNDNAIRLLRGRNKNCVPRAEPARTKGVVKRRSAQPQSERARDRAVENGAALRVRGLPLTAESSAHSRARRRWRRNSSTTT